MRERLPVRKQRRRRTSQRHASTVKERGGGGRLIGWRCAYDFIALMISSWSSCSRSSAVQDEAVPNVKVPQGVMPTTSERFRYQPAPVVGLLTTLLALDPAGQALQSSFFSTWPAQINGT
ncbi:hypothetical protein SETIT_2G318500v2 [Setaria italica]|uniref:Uncharacterized protein n=1 Tax=Setaria italica TaxID=4555 RepID=A0A368Q4Z4_SETIT|nr:uncharacterized protein LOC111256297 [Setaria italica]RCV13085.1 hypothetical protein SETIT_2G318500v2 [Setaria italica]